MSLKEASSIFGVTEDVLRTMTRRSIVRLFRRAAKKLHPDKGGTEERFVQLTEAYEEILKRKSNTP
jgi:curved DNA-binding protein CbpA